MARIEYIHSSTPSSSSPQNLNTSYTMMRRFSIHSGTAKRGVSSVINQHHLLCTLQARTTKYSLLKSVLTAEIKLTSRSLTLASPPPPGPPPPPPCGPPPEEKECCCSYASADGDQPTVECVKDASRGDLSVLSCLFLRRSIDAKANATHLSRGNAPHLRLQWH